VTDRQAAAAHMSLPKMQLHELLVCDGVQSSRIYVAVDGKVFDVSSSQGFYGPGGNYHCFAGMDATRALALGITNREQVLDMQANNRSTKGLSATQMMKIDDWLDVFESKYPVVAELVEDARL
jgi:membrane-associated progesterone receptor component